MEGARVSDFFYSESNAKKKFELMKVREDWVVSESKNTKESKSEKKKHFFRGAGKGGFASVSEFVLQRLQI